MQSFVAISITMKNSQWKTCSRFLLFTFFFFLWKDSYKGNYWIKEIYKHNALELYYQEEDIILDFFRSHLDFFLYKLLNINKVIVHMLF